MELMWQTFTFHTLIKQFHLRLWTKQTISDCVVKTSTRAAEMMLLIGENENSFVLMGELE